jgi:ABC-type transport system involved in multi-copper enzyme maturation permease subunit
MSGAAAVGLRELLVASRRWTPFLVRLGYLGAVGLVVWDFVDSLRWRPTLTPSDFAQLGRGLFENFVPLQYGVVSLAAALAGCDAVSGEARRGSLGLLALTPLSGFSIAAGKWRAAALQTGLLLFAGAPVLAVCVYLGGAGASDLLAVLVLSAALVSLCAALGVYYSCWTKRGWSALVWTALALGAYHLLAGILLVPFALAFPRSGEPLFTFLIFSLLPLLAAIESFEPIAGGPVYSWAGCAALCALVSWGLIRRAGPRIEARVSEDPPPQGLPNAEDGLAPRLQSARIGLFAPKGEVWDSDPLLWKERRVQGSGFLGADLRQFLLLMVPVTFYFAMVIDRESRFYLPFWWAPIVIPLVIFNGVSLFAGEKEGRRWEVLLASPMTPGQIVRAKLLGGFIGADLLVPFLPLAVLAALIDLDFAGQVVAPSLLAGLFLAFAYLVGAAAGLRCSNVRGAVIATVVVVAAASLGPTLYSEIVNDRGLMRDLARISDPVEVLGRLSSDWNWRESWARYQGCLAYYAVVSGLLAAGIFGAFDRLAGRGESFR